MPDSTQAAKDALTAQFCDLTECQEGIVGDALQFSGRPPATLQAIMTSALVSLVCAEQDEATAGQGLTPENDNALAAEKAYADVASFSIQNTGASNVGFTTTDQTTPQIVAPGKIAIYESIRGYTYGTLTVTPGASTADVSVAKYSA